MTDPRKAFAAALRAAKQGETSRWIEARAVQLALKDTSLTLRQYAVLRDGNYKGEQKYSNWLHAVAFMDKAKVKHEKEISELLDAGLDKITYYADVGFYWSRGAEMSDCIELLQGCVIEGPYPIRPVEWLRAQIADALGRQQDWRVDTLKLANAMEKYINEKTYKAPSTIIDKILPVLRTAVTWLREAAQ